MKNVVYFFKYGTNLQIHGSFLSFAGAMILTAIDITDIEINTNNALPECNMRWSQSDHTNAIRMEQHQMILIRSSWLPVIETGKESINHRWTVLVKVIANRSNRMASDHNRFFNKIIIRQTHLYRFLETKIFK